MEQTEALQILAILKAAYPNSYKGLTQDDALSTAAVWAMQFADMPVEVVMMAVNKIISISNFPPSIAEVKNKISSVYWDAQSVIDRWEQSMLPGVLILDMNPEEKREALKNPPAHVQYCKQIKEMTQGYRYSKGIEPSIEDMLPVIEQMRLTGGSG